MARVASSLATPSGPVTSSKKRRCSSARAGPSGMPALRAGARARADGCTLDLGGGDLGAQRLLDDARERRHLVVPLDERGQGAEARDGVAIELPDLVADGVIVRVEQQLA